MIPRTLEPKLKQLATYYPVVVVTGPRQSGKTTLCRAAFPDKAYVNLEALDTRDFAANDPRAFLAEYRHGAVVDEIQHVPDLLSYLQVEVDENSDAGRFILTGSQHFGLTQAVSQSLAGRCGILTLLPPSLAELSAFPGAPETLYRLIWQGAYPRIYDRAIPPRQWLADYLATYVERDVRQLTNIGDLQTFSEFLRLCAGRTSQQVNLSSLGADAGISHTTAKAWLSVLETSYLVFRLPAWHANFRKQITKAPKLHFLDTGLACYLLGIEEPGQLTHHPLRGALFESWVVSEIYKGFHHQALHPALFHYRESRGLEIDLLIDRGRQFDAIEIKSAATVSPAFFKPLADFTNRLRQGNMHQTTNRYIVYAGETAQHRSQAAILPWRDVQALVQSKAD